MAGGRRGQPLVAMLALATVFRTMLRDGLNRGMREQRPVLPRAAHQSAGGRPRCDRDGSDRSAGLFGSMTAARCRHAGQLPRATRPMEPSEGLLEVAKPATAARREKPTRGPWTKCCAAGCFWQPHSSPKPDATTAEASHRPALREAQHARASHPGQLTFHSPQAALTNHGRQRLVAGGAREQRISKKGGRARAAHHEPQALRFSGRARGDRVHPARPNNTTVGAVADLAQGRATTGAAGATTGAAGAAAAGARRAS